MLCTDALGKVSYIYRQVGVGRMVTSGSIGDVMVSTLAWNTRNVGSSSALGTIFLIFITPTTLVSVTSNALCGC